MILFFLFAKHVQVVGNKRVEAETIKSYIPASAFTDNTVLNQTLKDFYDLDLFKNVRFDKKGDDLVVTVEEHPTIDKIAFEGNKQFKDEDLLREIGLKPNQTFSRTKASEIKMKILQMYQYMGRHAATVDVKIIPLSENRVHVVFEIHEGSKAKIRHIRLIGNKQIGADELKKSLHSKEHKAFRLFAHDHYFNRERFEADAFTLQEYYRDNGYPDAIVKSSISEMLEDKSAFDLLFFVEEGERYDFGKVTIKNALEKLNLDKIRKVISVKESKLYKIRDLYSSAEAMIDEVGHQGFSFVQIDYNEKKNKDTKTIDIEFTIAKGPRVKIRRINIKGNTRTHEKVIRDQLAFHEGDAFNKFKLHRSERNLHSTGYFQKLSVKPHQVEEGLVDINIEVEEQRTGEIRFQLGYGTFEGPLAEVGFTERNIRGTGKIVHGTLSVAKRQQDLTFGVTDPKFQGRDVAVGATVTTERRTFRTNHQTQKVGLELHAKYYLNEYLIQGLTYDIGFEKVRPAGSIKDFENLKMDDVSAAINKAGDPNKLKKLNNAFDVKPDDTAIDFDSYDRFKKELAAKGFTEADLDAAIFTPGPVEARQKVNRAFERKDDEVVTAKDAMMFRDRILVRDIRNSIYKDDFGSRMFSQVEHSLTWVPSPRNRSIRSNYSLYMHNTLSGLGGSVRFVRNSFGASYKYHISTTVHVFANAHYTFMNKLGGTEIRIVDLQTLGGMSVHGFDFAGISPREKKTKTDVGGKQSYRGSLGISFPLGLPEEYGIRGGFYTDFGAAYHSKFRKDPQLKDKIDDSASPRVAIGGYLQFNLPFGPLRLDYAVPVRKQAYDIPQRFRVGLYTGF